MAMWEKKNYSKPRDESASVMFLSKSNCIIQNKPIFAFTHLIKCI